MHIVNARFLNTIFLHFTALLFFFFFFNDTATTEIYTLSLHDALPIRSTAAGPVPAGWPWSASAAGTAPGWSAAGRAGAEGCPAVGAPALPAGAPTTWTAACPLRLPTRASMIATPPATAVTVPLLSTFATATLFDDQMMRTVGITLPTRSNAVARSPLFSPTLSVMEGGATCTSTTFWANATPGVESAAIRKTLRTVIAART